MAESIPVSEELSSVETLSSERQLYQRTFVSEELSSVETYILVFFSTISDKFQKNLVVWKPFLDVYPSVHIHSFQKNLVVWKLTPPKKEELEE